MSKTVNSLKNSTNIHFLHNPFQFISHLNKHRMTYVLYMFNNSQTDQHNHPSMNDQCLDFYAKTLIHHPKQKKNL